MWSAPGPCSRSRPLPSPLWSAPLPPSSAERWAPHGRHHADTHRRGRGLGQWLWRLPPRAAVPGGPVAGLGGAVRGMDAAIPRPLSLAPGLCLAGRASRGSSVLRLGLALASPPAEPRILGRGRPGLRCTPEPPLTDPRGPVPPAPPRHQLEAVLGDVLKGVPTALPDGATPGPHAEGPSRAPPDPPGPPPGDAGAGCCSCSITARPPALGSGFCSGQRAHGPHAHCRPRCPACGLGGEAFTLAEGREPEVPASPDPSRLRSPVPPVTPPCRG